jgi:hypothetical protein
MKEADFRTLLYTRDIGIKGFTKIVFVTIDAAAKMV